MEKTIMRHCWFFVVPFIACVGLGAGSVAAQPLIDNLGEPIRSATVLGTVNPNVLWAAQSFSSPARYVLESINTRLGNAVGGPDAVAELRSGPDPSGPVAAVLILPALPEMGLDVVTLLPTVPVVLEPGTLYWLVLGPATTGSFQWAYAAGNNYAGPGFMGNYGYSSDFGVNWNTFGNKDPYQLRINASPIACSADFNGDGFVNSADFFDFLTPFFTSDPAADFNQDGGVNSQDFFDFLAAFFAGC